MKLSPTLITVARRVLVAIASLGTLIALFVTFENWRGDRAWRHTEADLRKRGVVLDIAQLRPAAAVPPERNFFEAPVLVTLLDPSESNAQARAALYEGTRLRTLGLGLAGKSADLEELREQSQKVGILSGPPSGDPAAEIRAAFQPADTILDELNRAALERPESSLKFRLPTEEPALDMSATYELGCALLLRATASAALGRTDEALGDMTTVFRLVDALSAKPANLMSSLVALALRSTASIPLREGLRRHAWTETQLHRLQALWQDFPGIAHFRTTLETERILFVYYLDHYADGPFLPWWLPRGWAQQAKVSYTQFSEEKLIPTLDVARKRIPLARLEELDRAQKAFRRPFWPQDILTRQAIGNMAAIASGYADHENAFLLARVAIALERYRLAQGEHPVALAALVPRLLSESPVDLLTDIAVDYARSPQGGFTLSVATASDPRAPVKWIQPN